MARTLYNVTTSWQQIATGICTITIQKYVPGTILFDEASNDATALKNNGPSMSQIVQNEDKPTFMKGLVSGSTVVVDEV
jgi:hypothetical protein